MKVSAYIPCFNNASTIKYAIESILGQTSPVAELFIIDDGSSDNSAEIARRAGVRVIRLKQNCGRGAVRALAMEESMYELIVSCDATNTLAPDFVQRASTWFESPQVSAVFGSLRQCDTSSTVSRWRGRHLFRAQPGQSVTHQASLATFGVMMRRSHVLGVGNFDVNHRYGEDANLGLRLLETGYDVVFDPTLLVHCQINNSLGEVLERYWRWYSAQGENISWRSYGKRIAYSIKVMAKNDLSALDPLCIPISLLTPHYQFWKSCRESLRHRPTRQR